MTPKQFYQKYLRTDRRKLERVASGANTTFENFKQIAIADGAVSKKLAKALEKSSAGEMSVMEILFPEDFETGEGDDLSLVANSTEEGKHCCAN